MALSNKSIPMKNNYLPNCRLLLNATAALFLIWGTYSCGLGGIRAWHLDGVYEGKFVMAQQGSGDSMIGGLFQGLANLAMQGASFEVHFSNGKDAVVYADLGLIGLFSASPGQHMAEVGYKINGEQELLFRREGGDYEVFGAIVSHTEDYQYIRLKLESDGSGELFLDLKKTAGQ